MHFSGSNEEFLLGAGTVALHAKLPPVVLAYHIGTYSCPGYSTSSSVCCLWPAKAANMAHNLWTLQSCGRSGGGSWLLDPGFRLAWLRPLQLFEQ